MCILSKYLIIFWMVIFAGCATVDQKISLNYSQVDRPFGRHAGAIMVVVSPAQKTVKNSMGEIVIGTLNNANGVHKADIIANRSYEEWVSEGIMRELQVLGYSASLRNKLPPDLQNGIHISNILAALEVNKGITCDDTKQQLQFTVELFAKGEKVKTFTVASNDRRTVGLSASNTELEKIMRSSLQEAMLQIIPEIIAITAPR